MQGWVKFHRKIEEWEWYTDPNTFRLFFHLVLKANHKPKKWRGVPLEKGQLITSRDKLAEQLSLTPQQIRTSLIKLKSTSEITIKSTNKFTLITIENYCLYQTEEEKSTSKSTSNQPNEQPTNNQQVTTNKNEKNEKNEDNSRNIYKQIYDYYISLNLIKHRSYTDSIFKSIKKVVDEYDAEMVKILLDRHKKVVELTKENGNFKVRPRGIGDFFSQKVSNTKGSPFLYEEYLEGGSKYEKYLNGYSGKEEGSNWNEPTYY